MSDFVRLTRTKRVSSRSTTKRLRPTSISSGWKRTVVKAAIVVASLVLSFGVALLCASLLMLRLSSWKMDRVMSVVVLTGGQNQVRKTVTLVWVDPGTREVVYLSYPDEVRVKTESGLYPLSALYGLYAIDKRSIDHFLLTLSSNLHVAADGIVIAPEGETLAEGELQSLLRSAFFSKKNHSSLSRPDLFALWWYLTFQSHQTKLLQLPETAIESVPDKRALLFSKSYDPFIASTFVDKKIQSEALTVAVINATGRPKMATNMSKLLGALGIQVLSVGDISGEPKSSIVVSSEDVAKSRTAQLCSKLTDVAIQVDPSIAKDYRTDIVLFLGEDQANSVIQ